MIRVYIVLLLSFIILKLLMNAGYLNETKSCHFILVLLLILTMFRQEAGIGSDDYNYRLGVVSLINDRIDWLKVFRLEGGNYLLQWLTANIFGFTQPFIAIEAFFIFCGFYKTIIKYSAYPFMSLYFFCMSGSVSSAMNISRQYMAATIIVCFALRYVEKKNFLRYLIVIMIASWFHSSAIVMIPLFFFLIRKKVGVGGIFASIVSLVIMGNFAEFVSSLSGVSNYSYVISAGNGMSIVRTLKDIIVTGLIFLSKKYNAKIDAIEKDGNDNINANIMYLMTFLGLPISLLAQYNLYIYRMGVYFNVGTYVLLPITADISTDNSKKFYQCMMILFAAVFGWYSDGRSDIYHNILFEHSLYYGNYYGAPFIR